MARTKQTARMMGASMQRYPHYLSGINLGDTPLDVMSTGEQVVGFGGAAAGLIALGSLAAHSRSTTLATAGIASALGIASLVMVGVKLSEANNATGDSAAQTTAMHG